MRIPSAAAMLAVAAVLSTGVASAASVAPELVSGASNKTCQELAGPGQTWAQLKVDPNADGTYTDGTLTVTVLNTQNDKSFDWTASQGVDAVFVKAGSLGHYLYRYDGGPGTPGEQISDTGMTTPGEGSKNQISHVTFCYDAAAPAPSPPSPAPTPSPSGGLLPPLALPPIPNLPLPNLPLLPNPNPSPSQSPSPTASPTTPPTVLGEVVQQPATLPRTGSGLPVALAAVGAALVASGCALTLVARRRGDEASS